MAARVSIVRTLFFLYAALWLAFAAATLLRLLPGGTWAEGPGAHKAPALASRRRPLTGKGALCTMGLQTITNETAMHLSYAQLPRRKVGFMDIARSAGLCLAQSS
jgi:hypothetical protein